MKLYIFEANALRENKEFVDMNSHTVIQRPTKRYSRKIQAQRDKKKKPSTTDNPKTINRTTSMQRISKSVCFLTSAHWSRGGRWWFFRFFQLFSISAHFFGAKSTATSRLQQVKRVFLLRVGNLVKSSLENGHNRRKQPKTPKSEEKYQHLTRKNIFSGLLGGVELRRMCYSS